MLQTCGRAEAFHYSSICAKYGSSCQWPTSIRGTLSIASLRSIVAASCTSLHDSDIEFTLIYLHPALKRSVPFQAQVPPIQSIRLLFQDFDPRSNTLNQPLSSHSDVGIPLVDAFWLSNVHRHAFAHRFLPGQHSVHGGGNIAIGPGVRPWMLSRPYSSVPPVALPVDLVPPVTTVVVAPVAGELVVMPP